DMKGICHGRARGGRVRTRRARHCESPSDGAMTGHGILLRDGLSITHDPLHLFEPERFVHALRRDVLKVRIRATFGATEIMRPALNRGTELAGRAPTAPWRRDIKALEKGDWRSRAAIHIIAPERRLGEADHGAVAGSREKGHSVGAPAD